MSHLEMTIYARDVYELLKKLHQISAIDGPNIDCGDTINTTRGWTIKRYP